MKKNINRKHHKKIPLSVLLTLLLLLYWIWMFHVTQPATERNTYICSEKITNVEIKFAYHRGNDKLYIYTESGYYMLHTGWRNETKSTDFANRILSDNQTVTFTVWKHFPQYLFDLKTFEVSLRQVVDLKSNTDVYWSVDKHNKYQKRERIAGVIAGILLSISVVAVCTLEFYIGGYDRYKKKMKRKKGKVTVIAGRQGTVSVKPGNTGDGSMC